MQTIDKEEIRQFCKKLLGDDCEEVFIEKMTTDVISTVEMVRKIKSPNPGAVIKRDQIMERMGMFDSSYVAVVKIKTRYISYTNGCSKLVDDVELYNNKMKLIMTIDTLTEEQVIELKNFYEKVAKKPYKLFNNQDYILSSIKPKGMTGSNKWIIYPRGFESGDRVLSFNGNFHYVEDKN